jgi:hypothetical protein
MLSLTQISLIYGFDSNKITRRIFYVPNLKTRDDTMLEKHSEAIYSHRSADIFFINRHEFNFKTSIIVFLMFRLT